MSARSPFLRQLTVLMVLTVLVVGIGFGMQMVEAQHTITNEEITLPQGAVFEILAQEGAPQTQYAWVLSLENTFLQAARGRIFRTRFTTPGRYLLSTEIVPPGSTGIRRSFTITIQQDAIHPVASGGVLQTHPADNNGAITLEDGTQLIGIHPTPGMLSGITLDADLSVDENSDGNPENDPSADGTFLSSDSLPLYLWITKDLPVSFSLTGIQQDGSPLVRQFTVSIRSDTAPTPEPTPVPESGGISMTEESNGDVRFRINDLPAMEMPILAVWDFGDGSQSMLMEPVHTFASSGTYIVRVRVKDIRNGIDIRDLTQTVTIATVEISPDPDAPKPVPEEPNTVEPPAETSTLIPFLLKILAGLMATVVIGAAFTVVVIKFRKGKSFAERLEEADKKMVIGKEAAGTVPAMPAPMSLVDGEASLPVREAIPPKFVSSETKQTSPPPVTPAEPTTPGPVPSWLQQNATSQKPAASAPALTTKTPTPTPTVAPLPSPATTSTSPLSDAAIPDWLTPNEQKKTTPVPLPTPALEKIPTAPKPNQQPEPGPVNVPAVPPTNVVPTTKPPTTAAPTPIPVPKEPVPKASIDGAIPAWLQPTTVPAIAAKPITPPQPPEPIKPESPTTIITAVSAPPQTPALPKNNFPASAPVIPKPIALGPEKQPPETTGALPAWLQPQPPIPAPKTEISTPVSVPVTPVKEASVEKPATVLPPSPAPAPVLSPQATVKPKISSAPASTSGEASQSTILSATTTATTFAPLSEKERERRRLKRQRYRQNKLRREKEVASGNAPNTSASAPPLPKQNPPDDAPVAFIRAESIENTSAPNPNPNPDPKAQ